MRSAKEDERYANVMPKKWRKKIIKEIPKSANAVSIQCKIGLKKICQKHAKEVLNRMKYMSMGASKPLLEKLLTNIQKKLFSRHDCFHDHKKGSLTNITTPSNACLFMLFDHLLLTVLPSPWINTKYGKYYRNS